MNISRTGNPLLKAMLRSFQRHKQVQNPFICWQCFTKSQSPNQSKSRRISSQTLRRNRSRPKPSSVPHYAVCISPVPKYSAKLFSARLQPKPCMTRTQIQLSSKPLQSRPIYENVCGNGRLKMPGPIYLILRCQRTSRRAQRLKIIRGVKMRILT